MVVRLKEVEKSAQVVFPAEGREGRLRLRVQQLKDAEKDLETVLPVEGESAREVIEQRIELLNYVIANPTFEEQYPCVSLEVLKWRDKQGYPKLAIFSLGSDTFRISADYAIYCPGDKEWQFNFLEGYPAPIIAQYKDLQNVFVQEFQKNAGKGRDRVREWNRVLKASFTGVIPQPIRDKIKEIEPIFSEQKVRTEIEWYGFLGFRSREVSVPYTTGPHIFLIAEVSQWSTETKIKKDPLVVGYKAGKLWLISSFDETPLEAYVTAEFAVKQK